MSARSKVHNGVWYIIMFPITAGLGLLLGASIPGSSFLEPVRADSAEERDLFGKIHASSPLTTPTLPPSFTPTFTPTPTAVCTPGVPTWQIVPGVNPGSSSVLDSVDTLAANDAWAAGYYNDGSASRTLIERWDGTQWNLVPSPNVGTGNNYLNGVTAASSAAAWAVGSYISGTTQPLILKWNGSAWNTETVPPVGGPGSLNSVTAISATDVWAVGSYNDGTAERTLTMHWNGTAWSVVPSPNGVYTDSLLNGVSGTSSGDVWAVGHTNFTFNYLTLILHWNGSVWSIMGSPSPGFEQNDLFSVSAVSPGDAWAVGMCYCAAPYDALTMHWNGSSWAVVSDPANSRLNGVAGISANDAWAVGGSFALHWDGTTWTAVSHPQAGALLAVAAQATDDVWAVGSSGALTFIERYTPSCSGPTFTPTPTYTPTATYTPTGTPSTYPCGVTYESGSATCRAPSYFDYDFTFYPHHCSTSGSATVSLLVSADPCCSWTTLDTQTSNISVGPIVHLQGTFTETTIPDNYTWFSVSAEVLPDGGWGASGQTSPAAICTTEATFTPTRTPSSTPTNTATATRTATCTITFTDVQQTDYFYEAVRYLYCNGAISGYADGTFRPYNNTTRGQLSKIVVLAEGWPLATPTAATFTDVPDGSPFYSYVETAYSHQVISGYSCGTGCLEFRPGNNITRAQLCKIVVLAEGWAITPPSQPTFRDVTGTDPFLGYIEAAYSNHAISGYSCGTGCLEFRPGSYATRGQISKIVYNAVTAP